ncbi:hypothetical protein [Nannocystis pusilla]|uniref:hypothetical protein n=1 Tax=Nannocystis pusilla TaxID=889268 RepID=UPI003B80F63B
MTPRILGVEVPADVHLAGPVDVLVEVEHATAVRATLDGVELAPFEDQGGGVWLGLAPCYGSVDNGDHVIEVSATNGPLAASWPPVPFTVKTPPPGGQAWVAVATTASGTTKRGAVTPDGDLLEVGTFEVDGLLKPSIRKRSRVNGAEVWPEGTIVLDDREGSADAVVVAPDGRVWVALNVKNANKVWQPRIVQLDADGHATGVEAPVEPGVTVRGLAADADGVVAVGFQQSGLGDMDVVTWHFDHDGAAVFTAKPWDYLPAKPDYVPHMFDDFAFDVALVNGEAWVVGASTGKHEVNAESTRGVIVRLDLVTGEALAPATVAPPVGQWWHSMFLASAPHPDGVVVTGNESTKDGTWQQITIQVFDAAGARPFYLGQWPGAVAYGTGVAVNAHGLVLVSGVVHDGNVLRGVLSGRGNPGASFDYSLPGPKPPRRTGWRSTPTIRRMSSAIACSAAFDRLALPAFTSERRAWRSLRDERVTRLADEARRGALKERRIFRRTNVAARVIGEALDHLEQVLPVRDVVAATLRRLSYELGRNHGQRNDRVLVAALGRDHGVPDLVRF